MDPRNELSSFAWHMCALSKVAFSNEPEIKPAVVLPSEPSESGMDAYKKKLLRYGGEILANTGGVAAGMGSAYLLDKAYNKITGKSTPLIAYSAGLPIAMATGAFIRGKIEKERERQKNDNP